MAQIFANNVAGTLAANIGPSDTLILLGPGQGTAFPLLGPSQYFYATLVHVVTGVIEVIRVTSRTTDTLTVERGVDNTAAASFTTGSVIEARITAQLLRELDYRTTAGQAGGVVVLDSSVRIAEGFLPTSVPRMVGGKVQMTNIPDAVATDAELALYAPKDNPEFTGILKAPRVQLTPETGNGGRLDFGDDAYMADVGRSHSIGVVSKTDQNVGYLAFGLATTPCVLGFNGAELVLNNQRVWNAGNFNPDSKFDVAGGGVTGDTSFSRWVKVGDASGNPANGLIYFGAPGNGKALSYGADAWLFTGGNNVYAQDFITTSDRREKDNIAYREAAFKDSDHLKVADFEWRSTGQRSRGPIAQDVLEYAPVYVHEVDGVLRLDKAGLALDMLADAVARIRALEAEVERLKKG